MKLHILFRTNIKRNLPLSVVYDVSPIDFDYGVIYAAIVLLSLYAMIIFEVRIIPPFIFIYFFKRLSKVETYFSRLFTERWQH